VAQPFNGSVAQRLRTEARPEGATRVASLFMGGTFPDGRISVAKADLWRGFAGGDGPDPGPQCSAYARTSAPLKAVGHRGGPTGLRPEVVVPGRGQADASPRPSAGQLGPGGPQPRRTHLGSSGLRELRNLA